MWVLPFALIMDNLTYGLANEQTGSLRRRGRSRGWCRARCSPYLGLFAAVCSRGWLPAADRGRQVAGAALLVAAGALFLVG